MLWTVALVLVACNERAEPGPRWIRLARGFTPTPDVGGEWVAPFDGERALVLESTPEAAWITAELTRDDWSRHPELPDTWHLLRPLADEGTPPASSATDGEAQRLEADGRELRYTPFSRTSLRQPDSVEPGTFCGFLDQLYLKLEPGEEPPTRARYSVYATRGRARDGVWRVSLGRFQCDGLPVWPGRPESVVVDVPPESVLSFATVAVASSARGRPDAALRFRVLADGRELLDHEQAVTDAPTFARHRVPVPAGPGVRLTFEVVGHAALTAFAVPVVGPREPPPRARDDLVLLLADTFRADNMRAWGAEHAVAPELDALAGRGLVFRRAWAPSSWTLPSQASMLSGLLPYQHGATSHTQALPEEAWTVAEHLSAAGYRTAAVTDAAFLSERFAMDQGFEWFDERVEDKHPGAERDSFEVTLDRASEILAADDGRPLFLWVQTYRVHFPYVVSEATRREWGDRLVFVGQRDTEREVTASGWKNGEPIPDELVPVAAVMRDMYLGGVVDFDRMFGAWVAAREAQGFFERATLVFTSDHGEAFGEHRDLYHGSGVWESQIRVPLFLFGHGVEPGVEDRAASLVDLPRTLADLAGVEPHPSWGGASLVALREDRPVFSFEASDYPAAAQAVIEGDRKLIVPERAEAVRAREVREAYDLGADPDEARDLWGDGTEPPAWTAELAERLFPGLEEARRGLLPERSVALSPDDADELRRLGYLGDDSDP